MAKTAKPTEEGDAFLDTPVPTYEEIPPQISAEDRLAQLTKDQEASQAAYRDTGQSDAPVEAVAESEAEPVAEEPAAEAAEEPAEAVVAEEPAAE